MKNKNFIRGLKAGIPIGIGYLSVSFTFGIMSITCGLKVWQAVMVSALTLTSAGQLAGVQIMAFPGLYVDMLISQLTINLRYSFMSVSLSQKLEPTFKNIHKWLLGFFITDEIYAVVSQEKQISKIYFFGVSITPFFGWTIGTLLGAMVGNVLPEIILSSLSLAIYGMFIAIILPPCKKDFKLLIVVLIAILFSLIFTFFPYLSTISSGLVISICAVLAAIIGAVLFPVEDGETNEF